MTNTEHPWGSEWPVHSHGDGTTHVIFDDSGRIQIYFRLDDDGEQGDIWDLYPCEASSLVQALSEALKAAELAAGIVDAQARTN